MLMTKSVHRCFWRSKHFCHCCGYSSWLKNCRHYLPGCDLHRRWCLSRRLSSRFRDLAAEMWFPLAFFRHFESDSRRAFYASASWGRSSDFSIRDALKCSRRDTEEFAWILCGSSRSATHTKTDCKWLKTSQTDVKWRTRGCRGDVRSFSCWSLRGC